MGNVNNSRGVTGVDRTHPEADRLKIAAEEFDKDQYWGSTEKIAISRQTEMTAKYLNGDR
ncbi:MAG: hypothetical protein EA395_09605 [Phormidium sp. GEM2.Bin31]|nr:MAG: hypothetical protein EA395_09605 [Phormidium sp. GEM2.Bin31]